MSDRSVLDAIRDFLQAAGVEFVEKQHEPTLTSADSARARGEALSTGAKALVIKTDDQYRLFVLPADRKADSQAIKRELGLKKMRFASPAELLELTGLAPGSVPPFGPPVAPVRLTKKVSLGSIVVSPLITTDTCLVVSFARKLSMLKDCAT